MTQTASKTKLASWIKAKRHEITLPSGTVVAIELPNLPALIKGGNIPNQLLDVALNVSNSPGNVTKEDIAQQADFFTFLVAKTVVDPEITEEEVADIPYEDQEMIVEVATRQRDLDALGHHLAGLERQSEFRKFRGLDSGDQDGVGI